MGTTLDNGIYLPDEGERNCYEGLAGNWVALDNHLGSTNIHVTINDKQAWDGHVADTTIHVTSADKQTWNSHVADTTIHVTSADKQAWNGHVADSVKHVTAEDKNKWDAVTSKADDSAVVHKTGNETASGEKTFSNMSSFQGSYLGSESSTNARTVQILESNRDTHGQSGLCLTKFRQNKPQGSLTSNDVVYLALDILENSVRTNNAIRFNFKDFVNDVPTSVAIYPTGNNNSLGGSTSAVNKWTKINGVEPSSLSLPDLNNGIDISSYITHLDKVVNNYTPPSNGWLSIRLKKTSLTHASLMMYQTGGLLSSCETTEFSISGTNLPVIANQNVEIYIIADVLVSAKFYPCQGNI